MLAKHKYTEKISVCVCVCEKVSDNRATLNVSSPGTTHYYYNFNAVLCVYIFLAVKIKQFFMVLSCTSAFIAKIQ